MCFADRSPRPSLYFFPTYSLVYSLFVSLPFSRLSGVAIAIGWLCNMDGTYPHFWEIAGSTVYVGAEQNGAGDRPQAEHDPARGSNIGDAPWTGACCVVSVCA